MAGPRNHNPVTRVIAKVIAGRTGQGMLEFAVVAPLLLALLMALIDITRAVYYAQVSSGLTRQGSNLASRGTTLPDTISAVIQGEAPLDLDKFGEVIVTSVAKIKGVNRITGQKSQGGLSQSSKIGLGVGSPATLPLQAEPMLRTGETVYITEVFYAYQPITPIGNILNLVWPSSLYEVAYF